MSKKQKFDVISPDGFSSDYSDAFSVESFPASPMSGTSPQPVEAVDIASLDWIARKNYY